MRRNNIILNGIILYGNATKDKIYVMIRNSPYKRGVYLAILISVLSVSATAFSIPTPNICQYHFHNHCRNEAGQLVASIDNASCGYYGYDGNGNRAYKLTGQSAQDQYNAGEWQYHVDFNDAVLYVNPYFIVTPKGYTRHYYNGSMHIASQIGNILDLPTNIIDTSAVARERIANAQAYMASVLGATEELIISTETIADIDGDELDELQWQCLDTNSIAFRITLHSDTNMLFPALNRDAGFPANVLDIYYYHADHLGSASWITNKEGTPIEYIHYMPYGELWYNWQASSYNERFKFTGKERDTETGYDNFGARYYSPTLLSWLSPDPLSDKYPKISAYAYCKWNPLKYVDPDGRKIKIAGNFITRILGRLGVPNYQGKVMSALSQLKDIDPEINQMISQLETSDVEYTIKPTTERPDGKNGNAYYSKEKTIYFDPDNNKRADGEERDAIVGLAHELGHAENDDNGTRIPYNKDAAQKGDLVEKEKRNQNERNSIRKENIVRDKLNLPQRDETYIP